MPGMDTDFSKFDNDLNGCFGAYPLHTQVRVTGYGDIFVVMAAFPLMISENAFTIVYVLNLPTDLKKGLIVPEAFVGLVSDEDKIKNLNLENLGVEQFDLAYISFNGANNTYPIGSKVLLKNDNKIYEVERSFLMMNSANSHIICYRLHSFEENKTLYCPHSLLVFLSAPQRAGNGVPPGGGNGEGVPDDKTLTGLIGGRRGRFSLVPNSDDSLNA